MSCKGPVEGRQGDPHSKGFGEVEKEGDTMILISNFEKIFLGFIDATE